MAIFNANSGGSSLQYTVKVQKDRPVVTGSKKIIWIKDDLKFLNPYENELNTQIPMTEIIAYANASTESNANKRTARFVHLDESYSDISFLHLDVDYKANSL